MHMYASYPAAAEFSCSVFFNFCASHVCNWGKDKRLRMDKPGVGEESSLPHESLNPNGGSTIVFIHGAFGSRKDWDMVTPLLSEYHLLVPDHPGHGAAQHLAPFSVEKSADLISKLIEAKASRGAAHVVGWSLGASVALQLARRHPSVVRSMVITGYGNLPRSWFTPYLPYAIWLDHHIENSVPRSFTRWLMDGTDLPKVDTKIANLDLIRNIFVDGLTNQSPTSWPARTLIIAATKSGIVPSNDNESLAKELAKTGREENAQTYAVKHSKMRHPWPRQSPQLFADVVRAWIEGKDLPEGFEKL